jgi:hypothetical protein
VLVPELEPHPLTDPKIDIASLNNTPDFLPKENENDDKQERCRRQFRRPRRRERDWHGQGNLPEKALSTRVIRDYRAKAYLST